MGIKVLFIYPNTYGMNMLPPAIALFSALLREHGHQVQLFDATYYATDHGIDSDGSKAEHLNVVAYDMEDRGIKMKTSNWYDDLREQVRAFAPDLIAISSTEDMWDLAIKLIEGVEDDITRNRIPVLAGGVFPTFAPQIAISHRLVDMVCVGEGEHALIDLCERLGAGNAYDDVTNLWVKQADGSIKKNSVTRPVNINELPMIDLELFEDARLYRPMSGKVYRMLPVETIRGCPFSCRFCNSPDQMRFYKEATGANYLRKKRMELVYQELKYTKEELGVEYNYFWADTFLALNPRELDEFCEMYEDIKLPFWMQTRPETVTEEKIAKLAKVGLHRISFGIEHGNEEFRLKMLDRRWSNADIIDRLKIPKKYDIQFSVNNITGFPDETREIAMDTVELNRELGADNHNIYSFSPFHGTPLRKVCEDRGLVAPDQLVKCLTDEPVFTMEQYPTDEIQGLKKCFVLYIKMPKSRWKDIRRAEADTPEGNRIFAELKAEYLEKHIEPQKNNPHAEYPWAADLEYGAAS